MSLRSPLALGSRQVTPRSFAEGLQRAKQVSWQLSQIEVATSVESARAALAANLTSLLPSLLKGMPDAPCTKAAQEIARRVETFQFLRERDTDSSCTYVHLIYALYGFAGLAHREISKHLSAANHVAEGAKCPVARTEEEACPLNHLGILLAFDFSPPAQIPIQELSPVAATLVERGNSAACQALSLARILRPKEDRGIDSQCGRGITTALEALGYVAFSVPLYVPEPENRQVVTLSVYGNPNQSGQREMYSFSGGALRRLIEMVGAPVTVTANFQLSSLEVSGNRATFFA